jgi:hypothetical protein
MQPITALFIAGLGLLVFIALALLAAASSIIRILGQCSWLLTDIAVSAQIEAIKSEEE